MTEDIKVDLRNQRADLIRERDRLRRAREEMRRTVAEDTTGTHAPVWHDIHTSRKIERYDEAIENVERELDTFDLGASST